MKKQSRVCAEISLSAVEHNFRSMRANLKEGVRMIAVVKTDAYGHGAEKIAHLVEDYPYIWGFAVATVEEGVRLRRSGIRKPVLILGFTFPEDYDTIVTLGLRPAVFKRSMAEQLNEAAKRAGIAAPVHIAVDTGMGRIGFRPDEESADTVSEIAALKNLRIEGLFTHFARADEADKENALLQFSRYMRFCDLLRERGVEPEIRHVSNSACIMELPQFQLDAVRAGITIYGIYPSDEVDRSKLDLRPVMELKSHISFIKEVPEGFPVSYGGTFVTSGPSRIATVPVGYGDGYPRLLSNRAEVLIRGRRAPVIGRVCMDQFMVDVTGIEAEEFDEVTLLGRDGGEEITVDELGRLGGRFPYEFVCDITARVPRVYVRDGSDTAGG